MMMVEVTQADLHEAAEIGERDGYEKAVQDIDIATGGDGEFFASTCGESVDVAIMKQRIISRIQSTGALQAKLDMAVEALGLAEKHLRHQAAFISKINDRPIIRAYSFESLGEDMPQIVAAIKGAKA